jgi:Tol biopolymer transport system component
MLLSRFRLAAVSVGVLLAGCQWGGGVHFDFIGQESRVTYLTQDRFDHLTPTWSPDGSRIVFVSNRSGSYKLWLMNRDGTGLGQLTTGAGEERYPSWSPDGATLAFASDRSGNWDIWTLAVADPQAQARQLTTHPRADLAPAWSRDGRKIAFVSYRDFEYSIYTMNADGSDQRKLTTGGNGDWGPTWSPDNRAVVFVSTRSGNGDLYEISANATPTGPYRRLTAAPQRDMIPAWSPDGSKIAFVSQRSGTRDIWVMNADGTNQVQLTQDLSGHWEPRYNIDSHFIEGIGYFYLAWSPDGNSLAYTAVTHDGRGEIAILRLQ